MPARGQVVEGSSDKGETLFGWVVVASTSDKGVLVVPTLRQI